MDVVIIFKGRENMKSLFYLALLSVFLAACERVPTGNALLTAMAQPTKTFIFNLTAVPTLLPPIPIPLEDLDFSSILIQPGDLPAGNSGAQVREMLPDMFDNIVQPVNQIYQELEQDSQQNGGIAIMVYENAVDSKVTYDTILKGMGGEAQTEEVENLGEQARVGGYDLLFVRCNTIVHFRMFATIDAKITYARNLDERLALLVCR
jgi:hypothetical protein